MIGELIFMHTGVPVRMPDCPSLGSARSYRLRPLIGPLLFIQLVQARVLYDIRRRHGTRVGYHTASAAVRVRCSRRWWCDVRRISADELPLGGGLSAWSCAGV